MTNMKSTKRALISSVFALVLCFAMLLGTTYAWFTDEVSSEGNIIQTGTLDIEMWYGDSADAITKDASEGAIFDYQYWEPGYTDVKYVTIKNVGSLAFKFKLDIVANIQPADGEPNLAEVIDVYMFDPTATVDRAAIEAATPVGTLADLMADVDGAAHGVLLPKEGATDVNSDNAPRGEVTYCIVLKMQEDAGNEYQGLSVGEGFSLQLLATQYTWENDAFDHLYDEGAKFDEAPKADVKVDTAVNVPATWGMDKNAKIENGLNLDAKFVFKTTESAEQAELNPYALYHADFVVTTDKDIDGGTAALAGYYEAYCKDYNDDCWVALKSEDTLAAGDELRLLAWMMNGSINYAELCEWIPVFECGLADLTGENAGTTVTVELRLYEVGEQGDCSIGGGCKHPYLECETGEYITIGTYSYTFGE